MKNPEKMSNEQLIKWIDKTEMTIINCKSRGEWYRGYDNQKTLDLYTKISNLLNEAMVRCGYSYWMASESGVDYDFRVMWDRKCDEVGSCREYNAGDVWA
jgi:hypothetical protein